MPRWTPPRQDCPTDSSPAARGSGGRFRRLAAALLIVLGAAVAAPEARAAVLVSNFGQATDDTSILNRVAQSFRTGTHAAGYTLTSILLHCGGCNVAAGTR